MHRPPMISGVGGMPVKKTRSTFLRAVLGIMGSFGMLMSLPCFVVAMTEVLGVSTIGTASNMTGALIIGVFTFLSSLMSLAMLVFAFKPEKKEPFQLTPDLEKQILRIASAYQGHLSLAALVMRSSLDAEHAQFSLDELVRRGLATTTFDEDGLLIYRFAGLARGPAQVAHQRSGARADLDAFDRELSQGAPGKTSFDFQGAAHENRAEHSQQQPSAPPYHHSRDKKP